MLTECCGRTIDAQDRYCPRCGYECCVVGIVESMINDGSIGTGPDRNERENPLRLLLGAYPEARLVVPTLMEDLELCANRIDDALLAAGRDPAPEAALCKEDEHRFGNCQTCGMPWLASRLEEPTADDMRWGARVVHDENIAATASHPSAIHYGEFEACGAPSCVAARLAPRPAPEARQGWQPMLCPLCLGRGHVPNGFYTSTAGQGWSTSSTAPETCRSCNGTGYVPAPPAATEAP